jgi:hypothetical protein
MHDGDVTMVQRERENGTELLAFGLGTVGDHILKA